jgi:uncharacterized membrane protein YphA (DoxX/SURF4 family)
MIMKKIYLGRHVFGLAAILFGVITLVWHDFSIWHQNGTLNHVPHYVILVYIAAAVEILGGIAIQSPRTARVGAAVLGAIYFFFALACLPRIVAQPLVYDRWGNFFEEFSQVAAALIILSTASRSDSERSAKLAQFGYACFGISVISFSLEQLFYLSGTAEFVPKWIPPGQMFWAVATTIAFALAAIALLTGRLAVLASQLMTAMIIGFQLLIWLPAPFANPHQLTSWAGNAQNLAIAGAAWIVIDFLHQSRQDRLASIASRAAA